jgi:hypothetical protein
VSDDGHEDHGSSHEEHDVHEAQYIVIFVIIVAEDLVIFVIIVAPSHRDLRELRGSKPS